MSSPRITAVLGDITTLRVDVVVNAANRAMRGGGGVDGAIHRAGGRTVLAECIARFPNGLATGDAGWTKAGKLPARWVVHTVGPNHSAGETDRGLLESCYRRALDVADELGARSVAFPLISTGSHGWPRRDAIAVAVATIASARTSVTEVQLVAFDVNAFEAIEGRLARVTALRILEGVRVLHQRGHHAVRILPGMSASGVHWRVSVTDRANLQDAAGHPSIRDWDRAIHYTTGAGAEFAGGRVTAATDASTVAELVLRALPELATACADPGYVRWYEQLMEIVEEHGGLPISYADHFGDVDGWEIGWGSGVRCPHPPRPPVA